MDRIPAGGEIALCKFNKTGLIDGWAEEEQMAGTGAVGRAEAADARLRPPVGPGRPRAFQPLRILPRQRSQQTGVRQQVIDVPVAASGA